MRKKVKLSSILIYLAAFVVLISVVSFGYQAPQGRATADTASSSDLSQYIVKPTPDNIVAANVAADVAQVANLSVVGEVKQNADSVNILGNLASNTTTDTTQPPILALSDVSREVTYYTTVNGDTIDSVAAKFHITTDTLRWANNYTNSVNKLSAGKTLKILPRNGILYVVRNGDTLDSIASRYQANAQEIVTYNDLEISGVTAGLQIIVPNGNLPANERPGYIDYTLVGYVGFVSSNTWYIKTGTPGYAGNTYAYGNCTRYAYDRRIQLGLPVSAHWGNAATWASKAAADGLVVNNTPTVGAILQNGGGLGHVAIVEKINDDGSIEVSEMNASVSGGGFNVVSGRKIPADSVGRYAYIH